MPERPTRPTPGETVVTGLAALAVVAGARAWHGSAEPWHYVVGVVSALLLVAGVWGWARKRKGR